MNNLHPAQTIIERWPSRQSLADDIGRPVVVVHRWHQRASIPARYDVCLLEAASRRNIPLNWRELMDARSQRNSQDTTKAASDKLGNPDRGATQ